MKRFLPILFAVVAAAALAGPAGAALTVHVANGTLTISGTNASERVAVRLKQGAPGTIQVDLGANGSVDRSVARNRFTKIQILMGGGADAVTLDESKGAFWNTEQTRVHDGAGSDTLTLRGTQGADAWDVTPNVGNVKIARGTPFIDADTVERIVLHGLGGADVLHGAAGLATLTKLTFTGGAGADDLLGTDGPDTFLWKLGDGNDVVTGDAGADRQKVDGSNGGDGFVATANGTRVALSEADSGALLDVGAVETIEVNELGGVDSFAAVGNLAPLAAFDVDGGGGNDTLLGSNGMDVLRGGTGGDFVDGNQGNDTAFLGGGDDTFRWEPGDASDTWVGEGGSDLLEFFASNAAETVDLASNGNRLRLFRNLGNVTLDAGGTERVLVHAFGGADTVAVHNLAPTAVTRVDLELEFPLDSEVGDGAADVVTVEGTSGADTIGVSTSAGRINITGLSVRVSIGQAEDANDDLHVLGLTGADRITAGFGLRALLGLTLDGGAGGDRLTGGDGDDTIVGGTENDTIFGGPGNDAIDSGLGADSMTGGVGTDTYGCLTPGDVVTPDAGDPVPPPCP
jgi:Ca2+-binding RTX toxin-like protein